MLGLFATGLAAGGELEELSVRPRLALTHALSFATTPSAPCNERSGWIGANPEGSRQASSVIERVMNPGAPLCLIGDRRGGWTCAGHEG